MNVLTRFSNCVSPRRSSSVKFTAACLLGCLLSTNLHAANYEILDQYLTDPSDLSSSVDVWGSIVTDGTQGRISANNVVHMNLEVSGSTGTSFSKNDISSFDLQASDLAITVPSNGQLSARVDDTTPPSLSTSNFSWAPKSVSFELTADPDLFFAYGADSSRFVAVRKPHALLVPVDQNRNVSLSIRETPLGCVELECERSDSASNSATSFGRFDGHVNVFGLGVSQSSTVGPHSIVASGRFEGFFGGDGAVEVQGGSTTVVDFQVTQPVSYDFSSFVNGGIPGESRVVLSNGNGQIVANSAGITLESNIDSHVNSRGTLQPGRYELNAYIESGQTDGLGSYVVDLQVAPFPTSYYPIFDIQSNTSDTDLWPVHNLIQGPGVGFSDDTNLEKTLSGADGNWVTDACGFPCDYVETTNEQATLVIDLGEDRLLGEIDIWGYDGTNANGVSAFGLRFATEAEGENGFGQSIAYSPSFSGLSNDTSQRQPVLFDQVVAARYVEFTVHDNFFQAPGDGSQGETPGGDRVGIGEIAFPTYSLGESLGDFNGNGVLDVADINSLVAEIARGSSNAAFDINFDTAIDTADVDFWVENLAKTWIGDANLDGEFNSSDFVQVFGANKFETQAAASWSEGDWNADGKFDSSDFVRAFQGGGYEAGTRQDVVTVPEPLSIGLLSFCCPLVWMFARRRDQKFCQ